MRQRQTALPPPESRPVPLPGTNCECGRYDFPHQYQRRCDDYILSDDEIGELLRDDNRDRAQDMNKER